MISPLVQLKITEVVCSVVATGTTLARLFVRRRDLWWDDGWAFLSMIFLFVQIAGIFMHTPDPADLPRLDRIAAYYIIAFTFYAVIWSARLSILFSVIRIDRDPKSQRKLYFIAGLFMLALLVLMGQLMWVCEPLQHWKDAASPQCPLTKQVAILQLVTDVLADLTLLIAPLRLVYGITDRHLRNRLVIIFSTCVVTTIISMVHATYILTVGGAKVVISALVEDNLSLIVANMPILILATFRLSRAAREQSDTMVVTDFRFGGTTMGNRSFPNAKSFGSTSGMYDEDITKVPRHGAGSGVWRDETGTIDFPDRQTASSVSIKF